MHFNHPVIVGLLFAVLLAAFGACSDSDNADPSTATVTGSPTASPSPTGEPATSPTDSPDPQTYRDARFGYSVELPMGWRPATTFMEAFANSGAVPELGVGAEDYLVLTDLTANKRLHP